MTIMLLIVVLCLFISFSYGVKLASDSENVLKEVDYCLTALKKLSDSTIYDSLEVASVLSASEEDGIFHVNTKLKIELSSPFFKSGEMSEEFEFVVMSHKEDGTKSFAIDEFPVMDEAAIEDHWVEKVESRRKLKEESFRRLELEAKRLADEDAQMATAKAAQETEIGTEGEATTRSTSLPHLEKDASIELMLAQLDSNEAREKRRATSVTRCRALTSSSATSSLCEQDKKLVDQPLANIYRVSLGEDGATDYEKERAREIVDTFFASLL